MARQPALPTRSLRTGQPINELGLGAAQFGNLFKETTDDESAHAVTAALDEGIRYFDTAPHYGLGLSEQRLGRALKDTGRDSVVLSSKVGRLLLDSPETADRLDDDGFIVPARRRRVWDFSRDGILRSVEESLSRLGTDYLDIAYLHDPDDHWKSASTTGMAALVELREQGIVRAIGAGMNQSPMLADFVRNTDVDVVMIAGRFTLLDQTALADLLPLARERGVGVVAAAVYNSGLLSSPTVNSSAHYNYSEASSAVLERTRRIAEVCARHGVSLPEAAIQYPLRHPAVVSVVTGMRTEAHVRSTVDRYRAHIPGSLWDELHQSGLAPDPGRID
ncbi:aldo/keto reductase [Arthrobacter sp. B2a2-09]|uniref:aldo/keto reductase n=1 Tax=Arthrobacter sp. B2a2-09 TaxID=2952822 RepID=UPI0022CD86DD|nr:aldo/keto reductase [Arthrobacter sp. B2a2-09]MCZ9881209.1 aldo/keto reductase [Arthrobacter sp. B2a2-09]